MSGIHRHYLEIPTRTKVITRTHYFLKITTLKTDSKQGVSQKWKKNQFDYNFCALFVYVDESLGKIVQKLPIGLCMPMVSAFCHFYETLKFLAAKVV